MFSEGVMRVLGIVNVALHLGAFTAAPLAAQRIKLPAKLEELEARARKDSNDAAAHYNIALAYWSVKRYDDAENALKRAVALDYRFAPAHLRTSPSLTSHLPGGHSCGTRSVSSGCPASGTPSSRKPTDAIAAPISSIHWSTCG